MFANKLNHPHPAALAEDETEHPKGANMNFPGIQRHDHIKPFLVSQEDLEHMQHDIRSPLGSLFGLSDILSATASTAEQKKLADILKSSTEDLKNQIDALFKTLQTGKSQDMN